MGGSNGEPVPTGDVGFLLYTADCKLKNWIEPCLAWASPNPSPSKTEIDIVSNPMDSRNVIVASKDLDRQASGCVWAVPEVTKDGGKTWTSVYLGGKAADRKPGEPLYGWGCITDPILAFDKDGWAYYALQAYNYGTTASQPINPCRAAGIDGGITSGSAFFLARSKDGGISWDKIIPIHGGEGNLVFHDYPRMASNPVTGSTYAIWNQFDTLASACNTGPTGTVGKARVQPVLAGTRDRGDTPIAPVYLVSPDDPYEGTYGINGFAASKDGTQGTLYVLLERSNPDRTSGIWLVKSTDDGRSWTDPILVFNMHGVTPAPNQLRVHTPTTRFRMGSAVELAVDQTNGPNAGCLYAAWIDNRTGDADVLSSRSCDTGFSWTAPVRVNHDVGTAWQMMTRVTVSADATVHLVYLTQAYDPELRLLDAEYAYSADAGATWTTQRLTNQSFDGDLGVHQDNFPFFGDYIGIDHSGNDVWAGFPIIVAGKAEIAVAHLARAPTAS